MEIQRARLSDIVVKRGPRLVAVFAPAGYGKSTFVRQLVARFESSAICDCLRVRDGLDLSRAVLVAFADALPGLADAIAQAQLGAANDRSAWEAVVLRFWMGAGPNAFVFENAETLARSPEACALFERLVRDSKRIAIVCSRLAVPLPHGRGFDPTNVVTFGVDDLRFNEDEIRTALPGLSRLEQAEIENISRGWPIVVALLGRAALEKPLSDVLAGLKTVVHDEMLIYLASEIIGDLSGSEREVAFILASLPDATYADIIRALPATLPGEIEHFASRMPISRSTDGILRLHPMIAELLREHLGMRIAPIVRQAATAALAYGDETRAAELFLAIDDEASAAGALRHLGAFIMSTPTPRLAAVISRFDEKTLLKFPALWCSALMHRGYAIPPHEWLRSADAMWNALPRDAEPDVRASVFSTHMNALTNIGYCTRAAGLLERYRAMCVDPDPYGSSIATLWAAALDSFDGRYDRIPEYTKALTPLLDASDLTHALYLYDVISAIPRSRGEWDRDAEVLRRARELFDRTPLSVALLGLVESAFARWLAGDDAQCDAFVVELEGRVTTANERGHRYFIACTRGAAGLVSYGYEKTKARAQGLLIASARAATPDAARRFASDAILEADRSERRYLRILARCALGLLDDSRREDSLTAALSLATRLDSEPMRAALTALVDGRSEMGMLAPFVSKYETVRRGKATIDFCVLRAEVFVDRKPVRLSRSELAVLIALAQEPRSYSVTELGDLLYPDLDADNACNRLHVYVHRLRQHLGRDGVLADDTGYRLGTALDVDLWALDGLADKVRRCEPLTSADAARLAAIPPSLSELEALAFRLRLPERLTGRLRERLAQSSELQNVSRVQTARAAATSSVPLA